MAGGVRVTSVALRTPCETVHSRRANASGQTIKRLSSTTCFEVKIKQMLRFGSKEELGHGLGELPAVPTPQGRSED